MRDLEEIFWEYPNIVNKNGEKINAFPRGNPRNYQHKISEKLNDKDLEKNRPWWCLDINAYLIGESTFGVEPGTHNRIYITSVQFYKI